MCTSYASAPANSINGWQAQPRAASRVRMPARHGSPPSPGRFPEYDRSSISCSTIASRNGCGSASTSRGTGLSLSISYDILVKQHLGTIEVDTQPGELSYPKSEIILP